MTAIGDGVVFVLVDVKQAGPGRLGSRGRRDTDDRPLEASPGTCRKIAETCAA